jgi:lipid-binding SYLF domain-containing protein
MNDGGVQKLLNNKVTLGADASVAAGPVGRAGSAATDAQLTAEMLAYSRTHGLFAGIDLSGGALRPDEKRMERAYGAGVKPADVVKGTSSIKVPAEAQAFVAALDRNVRATTGTAK